MKKVYYLNNLGCANCAKKMEVKIGKINGIKNASIDFVTKKLKIEVDKEVDLNEIKGECEKIIKNIEVRVTLEETEVKANKEEKKVTISFNADIVRLIVGILFFILPFVHKFSQNLDIALFIISYILIGKNVIIAAVKNIISGNLFDENFLMFIATLGAIAIKQFPEAVSVMFFYQIGELFQDLAVDKSRKSITELMNIRPDYANLKNGSIVVKVKPESVKVGQYIIIKPGEKIPLDGIVEKGEGLVDTSALTGEAMPRKIKNNSEVLSGFVNINSILHVRVTKKYAESTASKILNLVENASTKKANTEKFITKFSRVYTPIVVILALIIAFVPTLILNYGTLEQWIYKALIFLVVSCPCALVISIPLSYFGGIGAASRMGIMVKGGNYLEALNDIEVVVFDKTGTLTKGNFVVTEVGTYGKFTRDEVVKYASKAEAFSSHPIAKAIVSYSNNVEKGIDLNNYKEISGCGVQAMVMGKEILLGNKKLMDRENIKCEMPDFIGTIVFVAVDKNLAGYLVISDEIKSDAKQSIKLLKSSGIKTIAMLTGDNKKVADKVGEYLDIKEVYSELLPEQKIERLEQLESTGKVMFVGDGINDAPVLTRADIGVSMGSLGSDAAIEASDIVIMNDEPSKLYTAIKIARKTRRIVLQNIFIVLLVKILVQILGLFGYATMWEAIFADVGVALIAVINSTRIFGNIKNK